MYDALTGFHKKLKERKFLMGTHITCNDMQLAEMISQCGVDYIWMDTEHTAIDKVVAMQQLIALRGAQIPIFVRIPWNDPVLAKPILDLGADGIIFPMIKTADDARRAVSACLYPPEGVRGYGPRRAIRFGWDPAGEYVASESKKVMKLLQIETKEAVENIDEISRVPGVDVLVIGPMDLSGAYGKLGQDKDPEMVEIYRYVAKKGREAGLPVLVSMGDHSVEGIKRWVDMGVNLITVGNEFGYVASGLRTTLKNAEAVNDLIG